jgi:uncharacterized protein (TIGR03435 family)
MAIFAAALSAQDQSADRPKFEVASVKGCRPDQPAPASSPGRLSLNCRPLKQVIQEAYDTFASGKVNPLNPTAPLMALEGGQPWVDYSYTIEAKAAGPQSVAMMRGPMMQTLLEERFHLKLHRETREVPVYALVIGPGGSKLQPTKPGSCTVVTDDDLMNPRKLGPDDPPWCGLPNTQHVDSRVVYDVRGMNLGVFVRYFRLDRDIIDRTGLTGTFDIHLEWPFEPPNPPPAASDTPAEPPHYRIVSALRDQAGLRLDPSKGPREVLVVDHIEKASGN